MTFALLLKYSICLYVLLSASQANAIDLLLTHAQSPSDQMHEGEQEEPRGIRYTYGLNMGAYFAHDGTANYYNGSGRHSLEAAINRQHNYNRIRESLGYDFSLHALPQDMGYSPAMMVGIFGTIFIGERTAVLGEFNYARLEAEDAFSLELDRPSFIEGDNVYLFPLRGSEERAEIRLGLQHTSEATGSTVHPYFEGGMSFVNTTVRQNTARIEGRSYSIRNISDTYYDFRDDGIGYGGYGTVGLRMDIGEAYALALGATGSFINLNLGDNDAFHLNYSIFARIFLSQ